MAARLRFKDRSLLLLRPPPGVISEADIVALAERYLWKNREYFDLDRSNRAGQQRRPTLSDRHGRRDAKTLIDRQTARRRPP